MDKYNKKKKDQLGHDAGTASNRLRKKILFYYVKKAGDNICYQCGKEIETVEELSIEHKTPWLDSDTPEELFYDLDNVAFSHLFCNIGASRKREAACGTYWKYNNSGCRCDKCREANRLRKADKRKRKKGK